MTTLAFQKELARKIEEKRQETLTRQDIKEAIGLQREVKQQLRTYCEIQARQGWPEGRLTDVTDFALGLFPRKKIVRLTYVSGTPFTLPLGKHIPDCIYVGNDGKLYVANPQIWEAPHKSLTPFVQLRLGEMYDVIKLRGLVWSLSWA